MYVIVENGEMVAPIKTMRFDDSFYNFFGDNLEAVGSKVLGRPVIDTLMVETQEKLIVLEYERL